MLLVRTGGVFGVIVSLIVAGIFLFVVRPAINDTTDRAFDTADRIIEDTNRQIDQQIEQTQRQVQQGTSDLAIDGDYLAADNFASLVASIKAEVGRDAELLDFTANPMGGNVKYRTGDRAAGLQFGTGFDGLEPVKVTLVGSGKLADNVFPIAKLHDDASARLAAAVQDKAGAGFEIQSMTLGMTPVTGAIKWTVTGEGDGRQQAFQANADASGVKKIS
jgi:hypothetical protein